MGPHEPAYALILRRALRIIRVSQTWILTGSLENFQEDFVPAEELADSLEHVRKWPAEHWQVAFQGQPRAVSDAGGDLVRERVAAAAAA